MTPGRCCYPSFGEDYDHGEALEWEVFPEPQDRDPPMATEEGPCKLCGATGEEHASGCSGEKD